VSTTREVDGVEYVDYDAENSQIATAALKLLQRKQQLGRWNGDGDGDDSSLRVVGQASKRLYPMTDADIAEGVSVRPPCRFEVLTCHSSTLSDVTTITTSSSSNKHTNTNSSTTTTTTQQKPITVILDVAHNPPAMDLLANKLRATYPNQAKRIVAGFSADKDLAQCAQSLLSILPNNNNNNNNNPSSSLHLVEAAHPRAASLEDIRLAEPRLNDSNFDEADVSIAAQVRSAVRLASERGEMVIICGSVFIMSEVRETLGIEEPRDSEYIAEVAGSGMRSGQENFGDTNPEEEEAVVVAA